MMVLLPNLSVSGFFDYAHNRANRRCKVAGSVVSRILVT